MKRVKFPNGEEVCAIGQGTYLMGQDFTKRKAEESALRLGIEMGMNVVDTAEMYGNEAFVGEVIKGVRNEVFLLSKVWPTHARYDDVIKSCEESLRKLQTDALDMYLLHWMSEYPIEDTIEAMEKLRRSGKIRMWGVSNHPLNEMEKIESLPGGVNCATDEVLYNLINRGVEYDLLPWMQKKELPMIAYKPLGRGELLKNKVLKSIAEKHGVSEAVIALAWTIRNKGVVSIPKASGTIHVRDNYKALSIELDKEDLQKIDMEFAAPLSAIKMETVPPV